MLGASAKECFGKEKSIDLVFGEDTSPHLLKKFMSHYRLADRINRERGVRVWQRSDYWALMLCSALRGQLVSLQKMRKRARWSRMTNS